MADLNTYQVTFNCGRNFIDTAYFAANLFKGLSKPGGPPDLIVLSLQEVAPISYSFLGGSWLTPHLDRFNIAIDEAVRSQDWDTHYERVLCSNLGLTGLMLFAQPEVAAKIKWIETGGAGVGLWDMGNKGAVAVRFGYSGTDSDDEAELTFVSAHLAPMEDACARRNADWAAINQNLVFTPAPTVFNTFSQRRPQPSQASPETEPLLSSATDSSPTTRPSPNSTLYAPTSHLFLAGDLNYRTSDVPPRPGDSKTFPQPDDAEHYSKLLSHDQLNRERKAGRTLHHLHEAPITFPPTYKWSSKAQARARALADKHSDGGNNKAIQDPGQEGAWAPHRYPSWCDRILYTIPPFPAAQPKIQTYTSLPLQPTSDHQPVALHVSIPVASLAPMRDGEQEPWLRSPFALDSGWKARREAARRREVLVGLAAYLALTWEGEALVFGSLVGVLAGWVVLRSLVG